MLKKKLRKERKRNTKEITTLLKHDFLKNNSSLAEILEESILCYIVGANISSRIMSASFIERFIRASFNEFKEDKIKNKQRIKEGQQPEYLTYSEFLNIAKEKQYFSSEYLNILHDIKNINNEYSYSNIALVEFLIVEKYKKKEFYAARTALMQLLFIERLFYEVISKTEATY